MSHYTSRVSVHLKGDGRDEISLDTLPGKFTIVRTDGALTPYGGLAAGSGFLKHLGIMERLAEHCPVVRTCPNAAPVHEVGEINLPQRRGIDEASVARDELGKSGFPAAFGVVAEQLCVGLIVHLTY